MLSDELLNCIQDIVELQQIVLRMKHSSIDRLELSNRQASIESRLEFEGRACKTLGPVAECCCVAALITCWLSFTETVWDFYAFHSLSPRLLLRY